MPRNFIDTTEPGTLSQWTVVGASDWQAVARYSDDTTYIETDVGAAITDVFCGSGWSADGGRIMAVTLHYRIRRTASAAAEIDFAITRDGASNPIGTVSITTDDWVDGYVRVRADWDSGIRFRRSEILDLGIEATATTVPMGGHLQISKLWLEVEYIDTYMFYDPFDGPTPDVAAGDKQWVTIGTQFYGVNADQYLEIDDASAVEFRTFIYNHLIDLTSSYVTEFETRLKFSGPLADVVYASVGVLLSSRTIELVAVRFGGHNYLGFPEQPSTANDITRYLDIQPFDFFADDFHVRVTVDRDSDSGHPGKVMCYVNHDDVPLLEADYRDFFAPGTNWNYLGFGTNANFPAAVVTMEVDYFAWKHYRKRGNTFRSWNDLACGSNVIHADIADVDIVKHVLIDPPGIYAGQSQHCCCLDVRDPTVDCAVYQVKLIQV